MPLPNEPSALTGSRRNPAVVRERGERRIARRLDAGVEVAVAAAAEAGVRAGVAVARVAPDGEERGAAGLGTGVGHHDVGERELVGAAELAHEQLDPIELTFVGEPEVLAGDAAQGPRVVLHDRAGQEVAQRARPGRTVAGPPGAVGRRRHRIAGGAGHARAHREVVRHAAQHEASVRIGIEAVHVLADQAASAQLRRDLELCEIGIEFGHEQRIAGRQLRDERRIDREVVVDPVARRARPTVAAETLAQEQVGTDADIHTHRSGDDARIGRTGRDPIIETDRLPGLTRRAIAIRRGAPGPQHRTQRQDTPVAYVHESPSPFLLKLQRL